MPEKNKNSKRDNKFMLENIIKFKLYLLKKIEKYIKRIVGFYVLIGRFRNRSRNSITRGFT